MLIRPLLADDAFLRDVRQAGRDPERLHLWWLGQSGFLVQWQGKHLLLDPYLSDSLTQKYAGTDKPHVRLTERVVAPERLDFVDVVTSSHNHTDHLDAETIRPLLQANPSLTIIVPEANRDFAAARLRLAPERLNGITVTTPISQGVFTFHAVPAAHEALETDQRGRHKFIGYVVQAGPWTLYHSGDTVCYEGMVEQLKRWRIDVAILPINGRDRQRGVAGNLSGPEAAQLAHDIGARLAIPCHYEMFAFNTVSPASFIRTAQELAQPYALLQAGQRISWPLTIDN